jgi:uncharacterized Zn-finger protein
MPVQQPQPVQQLPTPVQQLPTQYPQVQLVQQPSIKPYKCNYCEKAFETKNGAIYHENCYCKKKKQSMKIKYGVSLNYSSDSSVSSVSPVSSNDNDYGFWTCSYCGRDFDTKNGATYHENFYCKKNKNSVGKTSRLTLSGKCNRY